MKFGKYMKKPIPISAITFEGKEPIGVYNDCPKWFQEALDDETVWYHPTDREWKVQTLEGTMSGDLDCYIVCGVRGEIYICDGPIFEESYESIEENRQ